MTGTDVLPSILALASFLAPTFYLWSMTTFDRRAEPPGVVVGCFVLGAVGAVLLNTVTAPLAETAAWASTPIAAACERTLLIVSAPEEAAKTFILVVFAQRYMERDHPMEGLVYGAAVGLGFAAAENVGYLVQNLDRWTSVCFVRSVVTVPVHGSLGVIAGIYVARARLVATVPGTGAPPLRLRSYTAALALPILLHTLYDLPFALSRTLESPTYKTLTLLKAIGLAIGLAVVAVGVSLTFRAASTQDPAFEPRCLSPHLLRAPWRLFLLGSLTATLGLVVLAAEVLAVFQGASIDDNHRAMILIGFSLLAITGVLHYRGWQHFSQNYRSR